MSAVTLELALLLGLLGVWMAIEGLLHLSAALLRPSFQWLIGSRDVTPAIDPTLVRQYVERSFDPELGWARAPGTTGCDVTPDGPAHFRIDHEGCRANPGFEGAPSNIAAFGDSFTFCRLVGDQATWPHLLSTILKTNVRNFGVGNYGIDQAVLRFERELPHLDSNIIIMGIVPETIARIHSYWKHYFEYGNVLAFKPRFTLAAGRLVHHASAMQKAEDFATYTDKLPRIQALDPFYDRKFRRDLFRFPYLFALVARWRRHAPILFHLIAGQIFGHRESRRRKAFAIVMKENARATAVLYRNENATALLRAIVTRFAERCAKDGRTPLLAVLPQLVDLDRRDRGHDDYRQFFADLDALAPVVDFTDLFHRHPHRRSLYIEGPLGPHFSAAGNRLVAETLAARIVELGRRDSALVSAAQDKRGQPTGGLCG